MEKKIQSHTVSAFDEELKTIAKSLVKMGHLVIEAKDIFLETLEGNKDIEKNIKKAREMDHKVNQLDKQVEELSTGIIALRNPLAIDLRFVVSSIKISTILERQGDMIEGAVGKILNIDSKIVSNYKAEIKYMCDLTSQMIESSIQGFSNQNIQDANKVWRLEDKVDEIADNLFDKIKKDIKASPNDADDYVSLMLIVRSLERVGDYCTKITKAAHYVDTGKRVSEKDF